MTATNVNAMRTIINELEAGKTISDALKIVYTKRNVCIPYVDEVFNVDVRELGMSGRVTNTLLRNHITTINEAIKINEQTPIKGMRGIATGLCTEFFETILNYSFDCMSADVKAMFLIDVVERNRIYLR
jgi:hypothetical protein